MSPRTISLALITACGPLLAAEPSSAPLDPAAIAADPVRYLENDRLKLGWNPIQAGSVARVPPQTTGFERGED